MKKKLENTPYMQGKKDYVLITGDVFTHPSYRRMGFARQMVEYLNNVLVHEIRDRFGKPVKQVFTFKGGGEMLRSLYERLGYNEFENGLFKDFK